MCEGSIDRAFQKYDVSADIHAGMMYLIYAQYSLVGEREPVLL